MDSNITNINDNILILFSWYDYTLFSLMLLLSAAIGIYFGFFGNKQSTPDEYLLGGKDMSVLPIALSLVGSAISGTHLLAVPTEVYRFGSTYGFHLITLIGVQSFTYFIVLPVFFKLQLTSTYEYLERRFNAKLRILSSFLFTISTMLYIPLVIYAPALAFCQATGTNLFLVASLVSITCIFYTTIGGLKAVVWTDALQFGIMLIAVLGVFCMGVTSVGGLGEVFRISYEGGRLSYDLDWDLTKRDTIWAILIGSQFTLISNIGIGQGYIQKYLSLPKMSDIKKALIIFSLGGDFVVGISVFSGLIIYSKYADCDPFTSGKISNHDQILPLYILEVAESVPGLAGLYLSGLFSAALSTLSASMNCLSGTLYEDFISPFMPKNITKKTVSNILKLLVVIIGTIGTGMIFVIQMLDGSILPIQFSLMSMTGGPLLGLFTMGMLVPMANSKGAMAGSLGSLLIMSFIVIKSQIYQMQGFIHDVPKPISIDGCESMFNQTLVTTVSPPTTVSSTNDETFVLFRITYYYYAMMGTLLVYLIAIPVSFATRNKNIDKPLDKNLITPLMQWCCEDETVANSKLYYSVDKAMNIVQSNDMETDLKQK